jgi:phosphomannomutase
MPKRDRPTPLIAYTVADRNLAGAVMITASHNPPEYNGIKFIPDDGAPALPDVTEAIERNLATFEPLPPEQHGEVREIDVCTPYFEHAGSLLASDCTGVHVAYDAMYGSGRGTTDTLLRRNGASVDRLRCERDPTFGGTAPEPAADHLEELIKRVTDGEADIGIANDGDADRIAVVTPERGYLNENLLYAVLYEYLLESDLGPAVRTVSTTFLVDRIAAAHDQSVLETAVGFKWVAEAMETHDALIGGEESGGFSVRGHVREKDGVLMTLVAANAEQQEPLDDRLDRLLNEHGEIYQDKISVDCPDSEKSRVLSALTEFIPEQIAGETVEDVISVDGFKLLLSDGSWLLVRPSGTEPKMRVYAEAGSTKRIEELLSAGQSLLAPVL